MQAIDKPLKGTARVRGSKVVGRTPR